MVTGRSARSSRLRRRSQRNPVGHERTQPRRHACPLDGLGAVEARHPALAAPAGVRHAPRRGVRTRQAPRDGLRDDHRPRHDRGRADDRRSPRHVHLRGADGLLQGRAAGRPRPLLRDHARRPRVAAGPQRRRRDLRRVSAREHEITAALAHPFFAVERAADARATAAASRSCSRSGRPATARARRSSTCRRSCTSRPTGEPRSVAPTTTPESISAARSRRPRARTRPTEFLAHIRAGRAARPRRPGQRREVDPRRDGARDPQRSAAATAPTRPTRARC